MTKKKSNQRTLKEKVALDGVGLHTGTVSYTHMTLPTILLV